MHKRYQKGLSLLWTAVIVGIVTLAAMVGLMSARYERNYFAEGWKKLAGGDAGKAVQQVQQGVGGAVIPAAAQAGADVRKCMVDGKVVYSNVECGKGNPTSQQVKIHDTRGFEAPKVPAAPVPEEGAPTMRDKAIDKAVER
ncbi:MAG TPA: DUF4124 domain-containing protein [Noviherbaspirillum sp.]|uniref:DUF4124 domain-containing protein n=1 Tax=Noviherbaspirillum sp. TaxID=1926288 RepID=UPI002D2D054D|nr:DUF4124 domain-containing protein [Noviherbaspirillum sp.]HYD95620.1 DUF4124 domain-containing protein [Noviherbaspirillum sp.]